MPCVVNFYILNGKYYIHKIIHLQRVTARTSHVTYVTMVPRVRNETLRPLGVAMGNAVSVTRV